MNHMRKGWSRVTIAVRAMAVVLVLACLAPQGMEARAPTLASVGGDGAPPAGLSGGDWAAVQSRLAQAGTHVPLMTSEVAKLTADDAAPADFFGYSVAASGDTVVVGAHWADNTGAAYIFARNYDPADPGTPLADNWGQVQKLTASDAAGGDEFGCAVAISGDTIVVGAYDDDDGGNASGSAYVFERNKGGADNWGEVQKLTASDASAGLRFGKSVAVSGDTVVVGSDVGGGGAAYVFERNKGGVENWGEVEKLTADDAAYGDEFGYSVAISGDTIVVGAFGDDDWGDVSGSAYVFARNYDPGPPITSLADNWGQVQKLTASDAGAWDRFGASVSISGDTVVVGAWGDDDNAVSAYVFERNYDPGDPGTPQADNWGQVQKLTASDAVASDYFGYSVAISGDTVVVGAYGDDAKAGSVYVFERNWGGADNWGQVDKLTAAGATADDRFGYSVTISGDTVVAGAYGDDDWGSTSGSAYVFARRGAAWEQQQKPVAGDAAASDFFGTSVAASGDAFIAGAPGNDNSGSAYLFYRNQDGADRWGQVRKRHNSLLPSGAEFGTSVAIDVDTAAVGTHYADVAYIFERNGGGGDLWGHVKTLSGATGSGFGRSVSISGDTAVVGAPIDHTACIVCGAAYVYERNYDPSNPGIPLADNWGLRAVLTATYNAESGDQFGYSVAISGDTVVVGARTDTHSGQDDAGSVYVFKRNYDWDHPATPKADNWGLVRNLTADDAAEDDCFGSAVAISGDTFVVGAPCDDNHTGSIYVFERNHDWPDGWGQVRKVTADDAASGDQFGIAVGISGGTIAMGAPYDDDGGDASGSAYLFERNKGGVDDWGQVEKLSASDAAEGDRFGSSVAISGNTIVVGAPYVDDGGDWSGSAYVFRWGAAGVYLPLVVKD